ncbi:hypothetical protein BHECKSOX2_1511 [Bathymodiolus heckerae thiotrophic gill symbiont]|uniref:hypothetical protein n=1 Tax=Bathymodiolus heckerae thiotrophic gill symbiont TaxID=1052212 RepID=UPI0010B5AC6B|nr:hypothetical protein [Bathymodiolus heckerae thiotrophic gill symbiont]SMN14156.1 hypothetical protein BHECKSOX2_1511 [Bathymodiolus heckerae thiotrophic gill symbiont]
MGLAISILAEFEDEKIKSELANVLLNLKIKKDIEIEKTKQVEYLTGLFSALGIFLSSSMILFGFIYIGLKLYKSGR